MKIKSLILETVIKAVRCDNTVSNTTFYTIYCSTASHTLKMAWHSISQVFIIRSSQEVLAPTGSEIMRQCFKPEDAGTLTA